MPQRYFLEIAYNGKQYSGWQVQPNNVTVQSTITEAISTLLNSQTSVTGCGRTDSGVHASQYFLHFDTDQPLPDQFAYRLNTMLPKDIHSKRLIENFPEGAHARFDATYRAYDYYIHFEKNPFKYELSCLFPAIPLDIESMQEVVALLPTYTDFPMLCKTGGDNKTTLCTIYKTELIYDELGKTMRFHVAANRFLRGMVRRMVGLLMMVGKGKISVVEFKAVMDKKESQFKYNHSVPGHGLYLSEVRYDFIEDTKAPKPV